MDFCGGGELFYHLKKEGRFSEERVRLYAAEILLALEHLHSLNIIYRSVMIDYLTMALFNLEWLEI
jgi:serine/threonine protein kinase